MLCCILSGKIYPRIFYGNIFCCILYETIFCCILSESFCCIFTWEIFVAFYPKRYPVVSFLERYLLHLIWKDPFTYQSQIQSNGLEMPNHIWWKVNAGLIEWATSVYFCPLFVLFKPHWPSLITSSAMVDVANSLTKVINFERLVENFRISFCPDTAESWSKTSIYISWQSLRVFLIV